MSRALFASSSLSAAAALALVKSPELQMRADVERVLPGILSNLIHAALNTHGFQIRRDFALLLMRVAREDFKDFDALTVTIVSDKSADEATGILKAGNDDDIRVIWVAVHHMILKLAALGVDVSPDLRLVAAGIETELQRNEDRYGGAKRVYEVSARLENEARRRGWWPQLGVRAPQAG